MKNKWIIITLIFIILGLVGYIGYDKLVLDNKEDVIDNTINNSEYGKKSIVVSAYEGIEYMHVTDENYITDDEETIWMRASIPKLVSVTANAIKFNNKIYDRYKSFIDDIENGYSALTGEGKYSTFSVNYRYEISDNIVYILITSGGGALMHSGWQRYEVFYYDLKKDKEITLEEIYKRYNIKVDKIKKEWEEQRKFDEFISELENNLFYIMPYTTRVSPFGTYYAYIPQLYEYEEIVFSVNE